MERWTFGSTHFVNTFLFVAKETSRAKIFNPPEYMHILGKVAGLLIVATCWGFTNPFIKRGTLGLDQVSAKYANASWIKRTVAEYVYLLTKWQVRLVVKS